MTPIRSFALLGIDTTPVTVEVDLLRRLPSVAIVGLPLISVRESTDRVRSAMLACGFDFPRQRVVVALSPADLPKSGTGYDLPIAAAVLTACGKLTLPDDYVLWGELTLGGEVRGVRGAVCFARNHPSTVLVCAYDSAKQVVAMGGRAIGIHTLGELMDLPPEMHSDGTPLEAPPAPQALDFKDVRGLDPTVIDALVEAAVNRIPVLLLGPPGSGKTMIAARCPGLLPAHLTPEESKDIAAIQDAAGLSTARSDMYTERPFRAPHHTISAAGLVGGSSMRPGECTLAHKGVLFLDELPEFPRASLEVMPHRRGDKTIGVVRSAGSSFFPADYWLIMAANECPCGSSPSRPCGCSPEQKERYNARLAANCPKGTKVIHLKAIPMRTFVGENPGTSTADLRLRVNVLRNFRDSEEEASGGALATL